MGIISGVIFLAIVSATMGILVSYSNIDAHIGNEIKVSIDRGFIAFEDSIDLYEKQNQELIWVEDCPPGFVSGSSECEWDRKIDVNNNGSIDPLNWETLLIPDYMQKPILKRNFTWSLGEDTSTGELFACALGPNESYSRYAISGLINSYPDGRLIVSDSCNGVNLTSSQIMNYSGSTLAATLKL